MHELSIAQNIVEIVRQAASAEGNRKVLAVNVRIGDLSGVVVDSLDFCFTAITAGTPLEGARLNIERVNVRATCRGCGATCEIKEMVFVCPSCGGGSLEIQSGRELHVSEIEVSGNDGENDDRNYD